jgi:hypothetical protein
MMVASTDLKSVVLSDKRMAAWKACSLGLKMAENWVSATVGQSDERWAACSELQSDKRKAVSTACDSGLRTVEKMVYGMVGPSDERLAACSEVQSAVRKADLMAGKWDTTLVGQREIPLVGRTVSMRVVKTAWNSDKYSAKWTVGL